MEAIGHAGVQDSETESATHVNGSSHGILCDYARVTPPKQLVSQ